MSQTKVAPSKKLSATKSVSEIATPSKPEVQLKSPQEIASKPS